MGWSNKITVEPVMFLQMAGDTLTYVIYQNLFIDKICQIDLKYDQKACEKYASLTEEITEHNKYLVPMMNKVQEASSTYVLFNSLVENSLPVFLVLFLGVWSDASRRRKPPLLLSLLGKFFRSVGLLLNAWFMNWPPIILLFTTALPHSLGGASAVFHMAAFSYLADSSVPRSRTWRLGVAEACWQLGSPVGLALGAYLFEKGGYICVFGTSAAFHLIAVLYTAFILPEIAKPKPPQFIIGKHGWYGTGGIRPHHINKRIRCYSENEVENREVDAEPNNNPEDPEGKIFEKDSLLPVPPAYAPYFQNYGATSDDSDDSEEENHHTPHISVKDFVVGSMKSIVRERPNHTRKCLLSIGLIMLFFGMAYHGESSMKYLYTRNRFQWREQQFSFWTIFEGLMVVLGLVVIMPIFSKLLKFSDPFSGCIAALGRFASRVCIAFAPSANYLFVGSAIDVFGVIGPLSARSLASKCVLRDERGRVFAFLGCIEALVPLVAIPLYSLVYSNTLIYAPSAIYYLSCGIYFSIFVIFGILFIAQKAGVVQFSGTDTTALTGPIEVPPGGNFSYQFRRTSLS